MRSPAHPETGPGFVFWDHRLRNQGNFTRGAKREVVWWRQNPGLLSECLAPRNGECSAVRNLISTKHLLRNLETSHEACVVCRYRPASR